MTAIAQRVCPSCDATVTTPYCPFCGEPELDVHDLTLRGLVRQAVVALVSVDSRLLQSFQRLVMRPGALTVAYLRGSRKPYLAPLQLFLVANVLFFALQSLTGDKILSTPLADHLQNQIWSPVAERLVADRLAERELTVAQYAPTFDAAVALNAKSLIVLMALAFAVLLPLAFPRMPSDAVDHALSVMNLVVCALYLYVATGVVYRAAGAHRWVQVADLVVGVAGIFLGYRFALLLITLATT